MHEKYVMKKDLASIKRNFVLTDEMLGYVVVVLVVTVEVVSSYAYIFLFYEDHRNDFPNQSDAFK